jgi:hypothetical protein
MEREMMKISIRSGKFDGRVLSFVGLLALAASPATGMIGFGVSPPFHLDTTEAPSGIGSPAVPGELRLEVFPNPAGSETTFRFLLPEGESVDLAIHDAAGRHIRSLDLGERTPGLQSVRWDCRDASGLRRPAGLLFVRLRVGPAVRTERLVVVR